MTTDDQNSTSLPTEADEITGSMKYEELPHAEKRPYSYYPASSEVCPRCECADYQPVKDAKGRDMRLCISCELLYLPLRELCPRCQSADYQPVKDAKRRDMRMCSKCGQRYFPGENDLPGEK